MGGHGPTDDEIADKSLRLQDLFYYMGDEIMGTDMDVAMRGGGKRLEHLNALTNLSPRRIDEEFHRAYGIVTELASGEGARAELMLSGRHLAGWTGMAADAFTRHLSYADSFLNSMAESARVASNGTAAFYSLAKTARQNLYNLCEATVKRCEEEIEDAGEREVKYTISMVAETLSGLLAFDPGSAAKTLADPLIKLTEKTITYVIEGGEGDKIIEWYILEGDQLVRQYEDGLKEIETLLSTAEGRFARELSKTAFYRPLPSYALIDSPDFRYEHFADESYPAQEFGPTVEEKRKQVAEQHKAEDSEINRRLGGAS